MQLPDIMMKQKGLGEKMKDGMKKGKESGPKEGDGKDGDKGQKPGQKPGDVIMPGMGGVNINEMMKDPKIQEMMKRQQRP